MFPFRKKDPKDAPPSWLKWGLIVLVGYALIVHGFRGTPPETTPGVSAVNDWQQYKAVVFPSYTAMLRVNDVKTGEGAPALCGQAARVTYQSILPDGTVIEDVTEPATFRLGEGKAMPALEQGVLEMQVGGTRRVIAPSTMAYGSAPSPKSDVPANQSVQFEIKLLGVEPSLGAAQLRQFDRQKTGGNAAVCGDAVRIALKLSDAEGRELYATPEGEPIAFTAGQGQIMIGLEQGVVGMAPGSQRTLLIPPPYQQALAAGKDAPLAHVKLPKGQLLVADIQLLPQENHDRQPPQER